MANERLKAAEAGLVRYHGRPCIHGHGTERYTTTGVCVTCNREQSNRYQRKARKRIRDILANAKEG